MCSIEQWHLEPVSIRSHPRTSLRHELPDPRLLDGPTHRSSPHQLPLELKCSSS